MDSDISIVQKLADKYKLGKIFPSSRKTKKYMIESPSGKWIHFGQKGYEDYTGHKDATRLEAFQKRNRRWANAPGYTPRWLAYHLLWNDSI